MASNSKVPALDETRPASAAGTTTAAGQQTPQQPPQQQQQSRDTKKANGAPKPGKQQQQQTKQKDGATTIATEGGKGDLSPAELKKRAKAEKQARRAREKLEREQAAAGAGGGSGPSGQGQGTPSAKKGAPGGAGGGGSKDGAAGLQKGAQKQLPLRRGSSHIAGQTAVAAGEKKKKELNKNVAVFGHLYGQQRRTSIAGAGKEVHPAVLALGLQMRDYVVCGSSARCVTMLLAFKRVCC